MPNDFIVKYHPEFFDDLDKLDKRDLEAVHKQIEKIKKNPLRFKRLRGRENCYSVRTGDLRIIYYVARNIIWFLVCDKRKTVYGVYFKRLYRIKSRLE